MRIGDISKGAADAGPPSGMPAASRMNGHIAGHRASLAAMAENRFLIRIVRRKAGRLKRSGSIASGLRPEKYAMAGKTRISGNSA
jgi:hypothetical protein